MNSRVVHEGTVAKPALRDTSCGPPGIPGRFTQSRPRSLCSPDTRVRTALMIRPTNPLERIHNGIRCRSRVVGICLPERSRRHPTRRRRARRHARRMASRRGPLPLRHLYDRAVIHARVLHPRRARTRRLNIEDRPGFPPRDGVPPSTCRSADIEPAGREQSARLSRSHGRMNS